MRSCGNDETLSLHNVNNLFKVVINATATDLFSYCDVHTFEWKNVGQDLLLWAGCWLDERCGRVTWKWMKMNLSVPGWVLSAINDWRNPAYVTWEKYVSVTRRFSWHFDEKLQGQNIFKHAAYAQMYCSQCMQLENTRWISFHTSPKENCS